MNRQTSLRTWMRLGGHFAHGLPAADFAAQSQPRQFASQLPAGLRQLQRIADGQLVLHAALEWIADWHGEPSSEAVTDRQSLRKCIPRMARGGSAHDDARAIGPRSAPTIQLEVVATSSDFAWSGWSHASALATFSLGTNLQA